MRAPEIWDRQDPLSQIAVSALAPLGWIYGASVAWKARNAEPMVAGVPVICVGNLTAGGTGKTPVAIAITQALKKRGRKPYFLSRGYGGSLAGPVLVSPVHEATEVGDEPLLLATAAPVIVSRDRGLGAALAVAEGADVIVMDDGHQNFSVAKDLSLVVVDGGQQFGNGRVLPAGPLREPVSQGLSRADAVIVIGDGDLKLTEFTGQVLHAHLVHGEVTELRGRRLIAFAGIGRPEKFFHSLRVLGAEIIEAASFEDHHVYSPLEIARLREKAARENATLITTGKDYMRLTTADRQGIAVLPVHAEFDDAAALATLLDRLELAR